MRPLMSSVTKSEPSGPCASPVGRCFAVPGCSCAGGTSAKPSAKVSYAPEAGPEEGSVGTLCGPGGTMLRRTRLQLCRRPLGEAVGEGLVRARGRAARERLEDDTVAGLRIGRAVPRAVEGDERTVLVARREG